MPSSRIPKTSSKTMSGAKRPFVSGKTDSRIKDKKISTTRSFPIGDSTRAEITDSNNGFLSVQYSNGGRKSPIEKYSMKNASKDSKTKNNAGVKAVGSYALNYYKKNSK